MGALAGVWIVFDTETATRFRPHHLLELGAVMLEDGVEISSFASLVRPAVRIDPLTTAVHGITESDVIDAPDAASVIEAFLRWSGEPHRFVAHNSPFDASVLAHEGARHGVLLPRVRFVDTLKLARKALPESPSHKLGSLAEQLSIPHLRAHRALDDARVCAELLRICASRLEPDRLDKHGRGKGFEAYRPDPQWCE
jgi:DNA polymerase III epsilon subunit-like protein